MELTNVLMQLITMASIAAANETSSTPSTTSITDLSPQEIENAPASEDDPDSATDEPPFEVNVKVLGQNFGFLPQPPPYSSYYPMSSYFYPGMPLPPNPQEIAVTPNAFDKDMGYLTSVIPAAKAGLNIVALASLFVFLRKLYLRILKIISLVLELKELFEHKYEPALEGTAVQAILKIFSYIGVWLAGGMSFLIIGGIFTTLLCNFTPICTISFNGYDINSLNKDSVKSLMSPEKIAHAARMIQDAIGKYQRLQRAIE